MILKFDPENTVFRFIIAALLHGGDTEVEMVSRQTAIRYSYNTGMGYARITDESRLDSDVTNLFHDRCPRARQ